MLIDFEFRLIIFSLDLLPRLNKERPQLLYSWDKKNFVQLRFYLIVFGRCFTFGGAFTFNYCIFCR